MRPVFFYGLFMDMDLLKSKGFAPTTPTLAYANGFGLRIGERATMIRSDEERVYGVIISLTEEESCELYSSASVADYQAETIMANEIGGSARQVVSYLLPQEKLTGKNAAYALSLATAARKVGLPSSYLAETESWAK
jgi:hypothetical protein